MAGWAAAAMAAGSALGALGSKDGGTPKIPDFMKGALKPYRQEVKFGLENYDPQFYQGQTFAGMSPYTQGAIDQFGGFDVSPSMGYYEGLMSGAEGGLPPGFADAVMEPAIENVASRFERSGRYGSPAGQQMMAEAGMRALAPHWNNAEQRRYQAAGALPQMQAYQAQQQLYGGGLQEGWDQKPITEDMARWDFNQTQPYNRLRDWGSLYGPISGAKMYSSESGSKTAGALGGALTGLSTYNTMANQFGWGQPSNFSAPQMQTQPGWNQSAPFMPAGSGLPPGWG